MSARIFLHPRCAEGPAVGACAAHLQAQGHDLAKTVVFWDAQRRRHELVRRVAEDGVNQTFERMDGTRFEHRLGEITESPLEVA